MKDVMICAESNIFDRKVDNLDGKRLLRRERSHLHLAAMTEFVAAPKVDRIAVEVLSTELLQNRCGRRPCQDSAWQLLDHGGAFSLRRHFTSTTAVQTTYTAISYGLTYILLN